MVGSWLGFKEGEFDGFGEGFLEVGKMVGAWKGIELGCLVGILAVMICGKANKNINNKDKCAIFRLTALFRLSNYF